jgi:predicted transposase YdaD
MFNKLSREEIDAMLGTKLEETRVFQEAQEEKAKTIALNMLRKNMSLETIVEVTGLSIELVQQLQSQAEQN